MHYVCFDCFSSPESLKAAASVRNANQHLKALDEYYVDVSRADGYHQSDDLQVV
jgi:hypothetical protein